MIEDQIDRAAIEKIAGCSKSRPDMWVRLISLMQVQQMAEVGVWTGTFAEVMLHACSSIGRYFMIDPWRRLDQWNKPMNIDSYAFEDIYNEALRRTEFAGERRIVLRGTTLEVVGRIRDASLDFVYIDGDHTLRGVTIDLIAWYAKVKPGGYLGGDDFCPTIWQHSLRFEPTLVFPFVINFAEAAGATVFCLPFNQFLMRKASDGQSRFAVVDFTGQYRDTSLLPQLSLRTLIKKSIREMMPSPIDKVLHNLRHGRKAERA
jgi:Methyltransferase domain